jgi:hypothetical protein
MDELTLKDLGTPVTEVGSPAVMEDMIYGHYNDVDVDSPLFIYQPDLYAVAMSPGGERDSSGLQASDSDLNSSMDSMEDNARSAACRRKDRAWLPYSRNNNGYGISIGSYNSKTAVDSANTSSSSGFGYVFTPAAVAASAGAAALPGEEAAAAAASAGAVGRTDGSLLCMYSARGRSTCARFARAQEHRSADSGSDQIDQIDRIRILSTLYSY